MRNSITILIILTLFLFIINFIFNQTSTINNAVNKAIDFFYENQLDYGEFKTLACSDIQMKNCRFDSSPFVTTFVLYSIKDVKNEKVEIMTKKAIDFLLSEQETGGIWRYRTSRNTESLPPDLDDISTVSFILKLNNISFHDNLQLILNNRNNDNLFFTWITNETNKEDVCCFRDKKFKNEVDCVVSSNILLYLGRNDPHVCSYINKAIRFNETCSVYYTYQLSLYYMVSRAFENDITCFEEIKDIIIQTTLNHQNKDGSFGNDLETALALNTLLNFNYSGKEIALGINNLLQSQLPNGSWRKYYFYLDFEFYYGSEELTTALVIEAMQNYQLHNSRTNSGYHFIK